VNPRVVFDTNVVVSALLFESGRLAWLREAWQAGRVVPLANKATVQELYRVLAYPKFTLSASEREELLGDYLPFAELVNMPQRLPPLPRCRDADDQKFIDLAYAARADMLVTGDQDLLALAGKLKFKICDASALRSQLEASGATGI
jgi:putative PIN family toxin of toxin-antitoxin system